MAIRRRYQRDCTILYVCIRLVLVPKNGACPWSHVVRKSLVCEHRDLVEWLNTNNIYARTRFAILISTHQWHINGIEAAAVLLLLLLQH